MQCWWSTSSIIKYCAHPDDTESWQSRELHYYLILYQYLSGYDIESFLSNKVKRSADSRAEILFVIIDCHNLKNSSLKWRVTTIVSLPFVFNDLIIHRSTVPYIVIFSHFINWIELVPIWCYFFIFWMYQQGKSRQQYVF